MRALLKKLYYFFISPNEIARRRGVSFGRNCHFRTSKFGAEPFLITIGDDFATADGVQFITHDGGLHVLRNLYDECRDCDLFKPIVIGNNVFIGQNAIVLPGTTIHDNVVVGAGSLVRGELFSNTVYAGVPVRKICSLDDYYKKNKDKYIYTKGLGRMEKEKHLRELIARGI